MLCDKCWYTMQKNGRTSAGNQNWRCRVCKKTKTEQPKDILISDRTLEQIKNLPQVKTPT